RHYTLPDLHLRDLFLLNPLHPGPPPLPYTTLFRSSDELRARSPRVVVGEDAARIRDQLRERAICSALAVWQRAAAQDQALLLPRSEEHTSELQSRFDLVCRLLLEKKNTFISLLTLDYTQKVFVFVPDEALTVLPKCRARRPLPLLELGMAGVHRELSTADSPRDLH